MTAVPASALRPRRVWYLVAGGIALLGLLAGGAVFVVGLFAYSTSVPDFARRFPSGQPTPVTLRADHEMVVYVDGRDDGGAVCTAGDGAGLTHVPYSSTTTKDGRTWTAVYEVRPTRSGIYRLTCRATEGPVDATFALGAGPDTSGFLASVAGLFGLTFLGVVAGGTVALVTAVRRRRAARAATPTVPPLPPPSRLAG